MGKNGEQNKASHAQVPHLVAPEVTAVVRTTAFAGTRRPVLGHIRIHFISPPEPQLTPGRGDSPGNRPRRPRPYIPAQAGGWLGAFPGLIVTGQQLDGLDPQAITYR